MNSESLLPTSSLKHLIKEFTYTSIDLVNDEVIDHILIDDGCYDFVFVNGKNASLKYGEKKWMKMENGVYTIHQLKPPYILRLQEEIEFFIIKVQPWANSAFFPVSLIPGLLDLEKTFSNEIAVLNEQLFQYNSFAKKKELVEEFLHCQVINEGDSFKFVQRICNKIYELNGAVKVNELVDVFKINRQQLNKIFKLHVHYSIKQFIKIVRIMSFVKHKIAHPDDSLTSVAYLFDYTDQSHLNNDFKNVCGLTPTDFFSNLPVFFRRHV